MYSVLFQKTTRITGIIMLQTCADSFFFLSYQLCCNLASIFQTLWSDVLETESWSQSVGSSPIEYVWYCFPAFPPGHLWPWEVSLAISIARSQYQKASTWSLSGVSTRETQPLQYSSSKSWMLGQLLQDLNTLVAKTNYCFSSGYAGSAL